MTIAGMDTLAVANKLKAAGFTTEQAEAVTDVVRQALYPDLSSLATKADLAASVAATKAEIAALATTTKADLSTLELRLTLRAGGMLVVAVGIVLAAIRYLPAR